MLPTDVVCVNGVSFIPCVNVKHKTCKYKIVKIYYMSFKIV